MTTGEKIVYLRKKKGITQEELATKLNVSRQSISKWEGDYIIPEVDSLINIANIFGVTLDYLVNHNNHDDKIDGDKKNREFFKMMDFIICFFVIFGTIISVIISYLTYKANIGLIIELCILPIAIILYIIFRYRFKSRCIFDEIDRKVLNKSKNIFIILLATFSTPLLVLKLMDYTAKLNMGSYPEKTIVSFSSYIFPAICTMAICFLISALICYLIDSKKNNTKFILREELIFNGLALIAYICSIFYFIIDGDSRYDFKEFLVMFYLGGIIFIFGSIFFIHKKEPIQKMGLIIFSILALPYLYFLSIIDHENIHIFLFIIIFVIILFMFLCLGIYTKKFENKKLITNYYINIITFTILSFIIGISEVYYFVILGLWVIGMFIMYNQKKKVMIP